MENWSYNDCLLSLKLERQKAVTQYFPEVNIRPHVA